MDHVIAVCLLLTVLLAAPVTAAEAEAPPKVAEPLPAHHVKTAYMDVFIPPHPLYDGEPVEIRARLVVEPALAASSVNQVLLGFNSLTADALVQFVDVQYESDARDVPLAKDERTGQQPQVFMFGRDLPPAGEAILMTGRVTLKENGQFHVGVLVIAFDHQWQKISTPENGAAETYAYSIVKGADPGINRPFVGSGNSVPSATAPLVAALVAVVAFLRRR